MTPLIPSLPLVPLVAAPAALPPATVSPSPPAEIPAQSEPCWWRRAWLRTPAVGWTYYTAPVESQPLDLSATATGTLAAVCTVAVGRYRA